ncbi:hypothetical protein [Streptomyces palmae]|uniref:Uncharacterized protein n=1 Tax=Streptomyces palmae TaxID=1701085 RepID=A0A4Z0HCV7_9ACTN|nr:hypothetical protein E4099_02775 [Streptomyces palmae]
MWDEWERLKTEARDRYREGTRLDGTSGPRGGDGPDLRTNHAGKKVAVRALRERIRPETATAGSRADGNSAAAVAEFSQWDTGTGLEEAHQEWKVQVKNLKERLKKDQEALSQAKQGFQYVDYDVSSRISGIDLDPDRREI